MKQLVSQDNPFYLNAYGMGAGATWTSEWKQIRYIPAVALTTAPAENTNKTAVVTVSGPIVAGSIPQIQPWAIYVTGLLYSNSAGLTLYVDNSLDGSTAHFTESSAVAEAPDALVFRRLLYGAFYRLRITTGAGGATISLIARSTSE